jgi:hypothetical protein
MKKILENILPKQIYVGVNPYCQPAYLDIKNLEYIMSNEAPNKKQDGLSFFTYKDFEKWTHELNLLFKDIENEFNVLINLFEISNYINSEFNFNYLPKININFEIQIKKSVILSCRFLLQEIKERNKIKDKFVLFLKNNDLGNVENLNNIIENVKKYKENYNNYVKILKKHYHSKLDKAEDSYSILKLSQRSGVSFIGARQFLLEEKIKLKNETNIETMRRKRLEIFLKN